MNNTQVLEFLQSKTNIKELDGGGLFLLIYLVENMSTAERYKENE